jgi:vancomycin resistance protein YoaR
LIKSHTCKIWLKIYDIFLEIQGNKAINFAPPTEGINIDKVAATFSLLKALREGKNSANLPYATATPTTRLSDLNNLGINELIAHGVSNFKGSPSNRRHNIKVGVEKFTGLIIQKGEEFSFNKYLGPVEAEEGFLPELVIKGDKGTVPELGGGLCQVSSTTFRAAMEAGLPILQRRNHAYAVQYYSPQGTDATIYPGVVDLKFKNDTPGAILVWPHFEDKDTLIFDFYGTKDSRVVTLEKPIQYDRKPDGSMKAEWTRIIEKDGVTSSSTFKSIYQPPALFHKQEQFVGSGPTPTPTPTPSPKPTTN